jgi:hypothetical protein
VRGRLTVYITEVIFRLPASKGEIYFLDFLKKSIICQPELLIMDELKKEEGVATQDVVQNQYEDEDDDFFDPFLHATVPRNLYHKFQTEGSKRWGPPTEILPFLYLGSCFCANEEELLRELGVTHVLNVAEECPPPPTVANRKDGEKVVKQYMMVDVVEHIRKSENQWNTFEACFNFIDKAREAYEGRSGDKRGRRGSKRKKKSTKDLLEERKSNGNGMKIRLSLRAGKEKENGSATAEVASGANDKVLVHCMHGRSRSATIILAYLMKKEGWTLREAYVHVKLRRPIVGPDKYLKHQLIEYEKHLFGKSSFQSVEEFREVQVQLSPELELKLKEQKEKEEQLQQEQSSSSNEDNVTKAGGEEGQAPKAVNSEEDEEPANGSEGKGSGKKKKKKKKKKVKEDGEKGSDGDEAMVADGGERKSKSKQKKRKGKKRGDAGSTSSDTSSAAGSPRSDGSRSSADEFNNEEKRKRGDSAAPVPKEDAGQTLTTKAKKKKTKKEKKCSPSERPGGE